MNGPSDPEEFPTDETASSPRPTGPKTPDLTKAQITSIATVGIGIAVSAGAPIDPQLQQNIVQAVTVIGPTLVAGDAFVRWSRAKHLGDRLMDRGEVEKAKRVEVSAQRILVGGVALAVLLSMSGLIVAIIK